MVTQHHTRRPIYNPAHKPRPEIASINVRLCCPNHEFNTRLPCHETDSLDDGGLNDLLVGEDTPSNSIRAIRVSVCPQVALLVDNVVRQVGVELNMGYKQL